MGVKRIYNLRLLIGACFLLILPAGCSGHAFDVPDSTEPITQETEILPPDLPPPSELKLPTKLSGNLIKLAKDYEQDLPHERVYSNGDRLDFAANWYFTYKPAFAMYWLAVPEYEHTRIIQKIHQSSGYLGYAEGYMFTLAANFVGDYWELISNNVHDDTIREYTDDNIKNGYLLVAVFAVKAGNLYCLIAGDVHPPRILDVNPKLVMTGDQVRFTADIADIGGSRSEPDSMYWDFGGGTSQEYSSDFEPVLSIAAQGDYAGKLVAANESGECSYDFIYAVVEECFPPPLCLYAIAEDTELHVGDETRVTVITGPFPVEVPCTYINFGLLTSLSSEYVAGSFNLGAPGGDKMAPDGFWEQMEDELLGFLGDPESWLVAADSRIPGLVRYGFTITPLINSSYTGGGEVCNFRLKFSEPGSYSLGFQDFLDVKRTYYESSQGQEGSWYDISNSASPQITVLP